MPNPFVHVELNSTDLGKARPFYEKLFDWKLQDVPMPDGTYTLIDTQGGTGGGMMKHPVPGAPSMWLAYVDVDDLRATTDRVKSLGGKVLRDVTEVPNMGSFSVVEDPAGAVFALWEAKS
ncbi:MAG: VOC family protein [Candidatus Eremiobacteraeota bacterium]|nr:VOC family protein [Candidatus Eremiobacteraeota bacterium]